jgi:hypothetical protein
MKVMTIKDELNDERAHTEINILRKIEGQEHLAQIVDVCEDKQL